MENMHFDFFQLAVNNINIDILEHGHLFGDENWKYYNINSPFNRLYFVINGEGYIENKNHKMLLKAGNIYLIPLHSTYNYICNDHIEKLYLHLRFELFSGQDIFEGIDNCLVIEHQGSIINELVSRVKSKNIEDAIYCKGIFLQTISRFIEMFSDRFKEQASIAAKYQKVYEFVYSNCFGDLTIKQIADYMNMSVSSISRNFKRDTGDTLKSFIDRKIIQRAKERLVLTDMTIKEIAYELRFADEFYFSRFFKKYVGMSPKEYRQHNRIM